MALELNGLTQDQQFEKAAEFAGVPASVFRGMWETESSKGVHMRSPAGARGHFGIMPTTQATWEERTGRSYNPDDFSDALTLAALTMKENIEHADGNVADALRMYNGGWDRSNWNNKETREYAGKVLGQEAEAYDGSEYASFRANDGTGFVPPSEEQVWSTSAYDLLGVGKSNAEDAINKGKEHLSDVRKGMMAQAGAEAAANAIYEGDDAMQSVVAARDAVHDASTGQLVNVAAQSRVVGTGTVDDSYDYGVAQQRIREEQQAAEEAVTLGDKMVAALAQNNIGFNMLDVMMQATEPYSVRYDDDPNFKYLDHIDELEADLDADEIEHMREARSMAQARRIRREIEQDRTDMQTLAADDGNVVMWSLTGGALDPVGWAAGMGVGKLAQLGGIGARAAFMEGNIARGFAYNAVEGGVGNVLATGLLDAAGKDQSTTDYAFSAGMGMGFGIVGGLLEWRGAARDVAKAEFDLLSEKLKADALAQRKAVIEKAAGIAGPGASAEDIAKIARQLEGDEVTRTLDILFGDVDDNSRLFARPDVNAEPEIDYVEVPNEFVATTPKGEFRLVDVEVADIDGVQLREVTAFDGEVQIGALQYGTDGTAPNIEVDPAFQRRGVATAMLKLAKSRGGKMGDDLTGDMGDGIVSHRTEDGQAFRSAAKEDSVSIEPRVEGNPKMSKQDHLPGALLDTKTKRTKAGKQYATKEMVSDDAERKIVNEVWARAERILEENPPIDKERLKPLLEKVGWEATSTRMLASDNPVMRAAGMMLLENPEGAGGRRVTAAMTKAMLERVYLGDSLRQYDLSYKVFRNENGGSAAKDFVNDRMRRRFDDLVYEERERRFHNKPSNTTDKAVLAAADALDEAYNRMRVHQKHVGTVGAARLADNDVRGYQPRRYSAGYILAMNDAQRKAMLRAVSEEFQVTAEFDKAFSDEFAVKYLERMRKRAQGAYDVPANLHSDDAADMVRDTLRALSMNEEQINTVMGRYSRGGAAHTKQRIDLDLTTEYPDGNGGTIRIMDAVDRNNVNLLRQYARRVSGEAALAKYGIMGEHGLKELRVAMEVGPDGQRATPAELEAFDQVAAEFLGKPFGTQLGKWADNARSMTSAIRLGGMGFNQFAEYLNGIHALGVGKTFAAIKALPRIMKDVRAMKHGKPVSSTLLGSIERIGGDFGMDGYRMRGMYDVNEGFEVYGQEGLTVVDRMARGSQHAVRVASFHRAITAVQTRGMAEQIVAKAGRYIREGLEDKALDDMGITKSVRDAIRKSDAFEYDAQGNVIGFDVMKIDDVAAAGAFVQSVYRGAAQIIQDTYIGETGKWAHDGWLKLLTQFRTYGLTATQKQWGRQMAVHGAAKTLGLILGAMSIAVPIHMARVQLQSIGRKDRDEYLDKMLSPMALGKASLNYVSAIGVLPDVVNVAGALTGFEALGARTGGGGVVSQFVPVAGVINDAAAAIGRRDPHKLAKSTLPGANLPYTHGVINLLD